VGDGFGWIQQNWFALLQCLGIVGGLVFTGISVRQAANARRAGDHLNLLELHRDLWSKIQERPELARVLEPEVDLVAAPITKAEEEFLNLVIVHFNTGWQLARVGTFVTTGELAKDVRSFFSLPVPSRVWHQTKNARDPSFCEFIERCLRNS